MAKRKKPETGPKTAADKNSLIEPTIDETNALGNTDALETDAPETNAQETNDIDAIATDDGHIESTDTKAALTTDAAVEGPDSDTADTSDADAPDTPDGDTTPAEQSEEDTHEIATAPVATPSGKGGFMGGLIGGLLAAALAIFLLPQFLPPGLLSGDDSELRSTIEDQSTKIDGLSADLDGMATRLADTTAQLETAQSAATQAQDAATQAQDQVTALTARIDALPKADVGELPKDVQDTITAQREQLATLETQLAEMSTLAQDQIETAEERRAAAATAAAKAQARGALNDVQNALANGGSFAEPLAQISDAVDVPEALSTVAENGVPTMQQLQNDFPAMARTALVAANRASSDGSTAGRLTLLFQESLGARSLTPRDGGDPDAVLSRAEASLQSGDIPATLDLVSQLPEDGQAALADWTAQAQSRVDATGAADALTNALSAD